MAITATFDGWGYTPVFDTSNPAAPSEISQITIPETVDEAFAIGFGDLTVHEVEMPRGDQNEGGPAGDDDKVAYSPGARADSGWWTSPTRPAPSNSATTSIPRGITSGAWP
jgi:hypothetical protein